MCGFCGEFRFGGAGGIRTEDVRRMRDTLVHRGPDDGGLFVSERGDVGLGFRRLAIIDLSPNGAQPMANEDGAIQLVFNGEIYNYRELREPLLARHQFRSQADSEVIAHLYEERGAEAIAALDGMFAIAIWDTRQRRLLLARDRAGKKPLFYLQTGHRVLFASEIKAFFAVPGVSLEPDPSTFPQYFLHGYVPSPRTLYQGVRQVEPGTWMTFDASGATASRRYWSLQFPTVAEQRATPRPSLEEAASRVRALTDAAVARRLVSDVPIGAFLSGGIDSSIVVGLMSRHLSAPVRTFSIGFAGDAAFDETVHARTIATRVHADHTEFRVTPSAMGLIEKLVWHHDGAFGDSSAIPTFIVSQLTRQHVTVALSGDGGDELFAGYVRFGAGMAAERIPPPLRRALAATLAVIPGSVPGRHLLGRARRFAQAVGLPLHERMTRWISLFYDDLEALFTPEFLATVAPIDRLAYLRGDVDALRGRTPLAQMLYANYRSYLLDDLLVKMDRCSMANSLETRSPLLDRELTEYVASLPDDFKIRGAQRKFILRQAFGDLLPDSVQHRRKMGFGVPLDAWFRGELRGFLREHLLAGDARYTSFLARSAVEGLVEAHENGSANLGLQLWTVLTFEVWLRALPAWQRDGALRAEGATA